MWVARRISALLRVMQPLGRMARLTPQTSPTACGTWPLKTLLAAPELALTETGAKVGQSNCCPDPIKPPLSCKKPWLRHNILR